MVDLLYHLPTGVIERVRAPMRSIASLIGRTVIVDLTPIDMREPRSGRGPTRIFAADAAGNTIALVYFNNPGWAKKQLPLGETRTVSGKLEAYGDEWQIIHPEVSRAGQGRGAGAARAGLSADRGHHQPPHGRACGAWRSSARPSCPNGSSRAWPRAKAGRRGARRWPRRIATRGDARRAQRLAYDEIFANQLALLLLRQSARRKTTVPLPGDGRLTDALELPYELTGAQRRVVEEIRGDMAQDAADAAPAPGRCRVGQDPGRDAGDADGGRERARRRRSSRRPKSSPASIMRPCSSSSTASACASRSSPGARRARRARAVLMGLADGSIDILVGTHAIFQEKVAYKNLGLAVIDEQHRFGVSQRLLLAAKAERPPHLLVMTATPIPRTLTLTQYGEMDVSAIDEMPPGRTPVETRVISDERLAEVVDGLGAAFVGRRPGLLGVPAGRGEREQRRRRGRGARARCSASASARSASGWSTAG